MKFILNDENLIIEELGENELIVSGTINYYKAKVEYNDTWKNLNIIAKLIKHNELVGIEKPVLLNSISYDVNLDGTYLIGFVGYDLNENNEKTYQISTPLKTIIFTKGAGQIKTDNKVVPSASEWELYIAQIQEMLKNSGGGAGGVVEETDPTVPQHVKNITEQDIEKWNNGTGGTGGTSDYNDVKKKPKINEIELEGNKTLDELGIQPKGDYASKEELANKASIKDMTNYIEEHKEELGGPAGAVIQEEEPTDDTVIWVDPNEEGKVFEEETFKKEMETYCANYIDTQITQAIGGVY